MRHCVADKTADTSISVWEWVDIVEAMMRRWNGDDPSRLAHAIKAITLGEVSHEVGNAIARWRLVSADSYVMFGSRAPSARLHQELVLRAANAQHLFGSVAIEFAVKPEDKIR